MYESGLSKTARVIVLILGVLLGLALILSGCSFANAAEADGQEIIIETAEGAQHHFF